MSLFTNVPIELVLNAVVKRWKNIKLDTKLSQQKLINALRFVMSSTYFSFNHKIYRQTHGISIGFSLSLIMANITLQNLELKALNTLTFTIPTTFDI